MDPDPEPEAKNNGQTNLGFEPDDDPKQVSNGVFTVSASPRPSIAVSIPESEGDSPKRAQFGSPIEFLLSCIAMSVGLGNIWRFPFVALKNGGGAFLIPYLIVLLLIGRPIYYLEMCIGQFSSSGPVKVWNMAPLFKGVGYTATIATFCQVTYYSVLISITIFYFASSFASTLPWSVCKEEWLDETAGLTCAANFTGDEALAFFKYDAVPQWESIADGIGTPNWRLALTLLLAWIIICGILIKGVESSGKVAYFTALFPYVVLLILLVRGVTLKGAGTGIKKFLTPQWDKLYDPKVWYEAVGQCFFSLTVSFGPIIMFASYNPFRHNIYRDALIISFMDTFTSLLAGITIFAILGFLAETSGKPFDDIAANGGTALAFVAYPAALAQFTWAPQLFAVLFFLMLFTLGLGSATSLVASVVTIICDKFTQFKTWQVTIGVCLVAYLIGLTYITPGGMKVLDIVDNFAANFVIYIVATVEVSAICYVYGMKNLCDDIEFMLKRKVGIYYRICWGYIIPIGLPAILIYWAVTYKSPIPRESGFTTLSQASGWILSGFALSFIIGFGIYVLAKSKASGLRDKLRDTMKPKAAWGPLQKQDRKDWIAFKKLK